MDESAEDADLEEAFTQVLKHPGFSSYSREEFARCDRFCEIIRQSEHADVMKLRSSLEEIAYASDDHNEASGVLLSFCALGGGFTSADEEGQTVTQEQFLEVPVADDELFLQWATGVDHDQREAAHQAAMSALMKQVVRITDGDHAARLTHRKVNTILYYVLESVQTISQFGNYALENYDADFHIDEQIPARLWEAFNVRPKKETTKLIKKWWGSKASIPHDFFIALDWQRKGWIDIHRGKKYHDTVAEFLLSCCEPGPNEEGETGFAEKAIVRDPFLVDELYEALALKESYRWLISDDIVHRANYLESLFSGDLLSRKKILSALDKGITARWDSGLLASYKALRERLAA